MWLFKEHRETVFQLAEMQRQLDSQTRTIEDLERQLAQAVAMAAARDMTVVDMFKEYQKEILTDQPFPDGKVPESMWLTPPREARDA